jgi:hypothetical protein
MTIDRVFPRRVAGILLTGVVAAGIPLVLSGSPAVIVAFLAGAALSTANVLIGFLTIELTFEKSYTTFLKAVLGGMGLRMLAMLGAMMLLIAMLHLHAVVFTVSLFGFYVVYLVLEILYLQKKVVVKNQE